jgi:hypothetical protein
MGKYRNIIFMQKGVRLRMIIFLTCLWFYRYVYCGLFWFIERI